MTYFLYILECGDGSLYTGITTDVSRRIDEHRKGMKGSLYTKAKGVSKLLYQEVHPNRSFASKREAEIKSWKREKKLSLVDSQQKKS